MARERNTDQRREQIVAAMIKVVAAKGYERASINAIAEEAGLTSGLVHYHFKRKLEILICALATIEQTLNQRIEKLQHRTRNAEEALAAHVDAYVRLGEDASPTNIQCWVAICAAALNEEEVKEATDAVIGRTLTNLTAAIDAVWTERQLNIPPDETQAVAAGLFSAIHGAYTLVTTAPSTFPLGFASPTLQALCRALLDQAAERASAPQREVA